MIVFQISYGDNLQIAGKIRITCIQYVDQEPIGNSLEIGLFVGQSQAYQSGSHVPAFSFSPMGQS
jgi:hypothetical protein